VDEVDDDAGGLCEKLDDDATTEED